MTRTQKFYFNLINCVLDVAEKLVADCSWGKHISFGLKPGSKFNPVSEYDKVIEMGLRDALRLLAPNVDIYGEECGSVAMGLANVLFVDPIDGTKAFVSGSHVWGTILGLSKLGNIVLGAVNYPMLGERLISLGGSTYCRIGSSSSFMSLKPRCLVNKHISRCIVATSSASVMTSDELARFTRLETKVMHTIHCYDCYAYALLAKGCIDAVIECHFKPYDFVGLVPILKGAGCLITDWSGNETSYDERIVASRSPKLQDCLLAAINNC
ncbi:MAG: inositol monophosphatase family protein [Candidatus Hodgkinia cicadicola]|nr:MAG: inositol monophosphatase family protein [Candidatus Hodgkinia cicadicola]